MKPWLVVEDENDIRTIMTVLFTTWGHTPMEFTNGHEAFEWLDKVEAGTFTGELPGLALMDIRMPGHYGTEIARRMRTIKALEDIPIILMTAFPTNDAQMRELLDTKIIDEIVNKPLPEMFELKALLDRVYEAKQKKN